MEESYQRMGVPSKSVAVPCCSSAAMLSRISRSWAPSAARLRREVARSRVMIGSEVERVGVFRGAAVPIGHSKQGIAATASSCHNSANCPAMAKAEIPNWGCRRDPIGESSLPRPVQTIWRVWRSEDMERIMGVCRLT